MLRGRGTTPLQPSAWLSYPSLYPNAFVFCIHDLTRNAALFPPRPADVRAAVDAASATLAQLQATGGSGPRKVVRGPLLAQVELKRRMAASGAPAESDVAAAALSYFETNGHLVSCASDLRPYTTELTVRLII